MDIRIFEILNFLNQYGVGKKQNIAPLINKHFPVEENMQMYEYNNETGNIIRFIDGLKPFVIMSSDANINSHNSFPKEFVNPLYASIDNDGVTALENENQKHYEQVLNNSAIETNNSIIATNQSVQRTNEALVNVSVEQGEINKSLVINSQSQTKILRRQTFIFFFTGLFTFGTVITSGVTLYRDISKDTLNKQLLQQSTELKKLRTKLQLLNNKYHVPLAPTKADTSNN